MYIHCMYFLIKEVFDRCIGCNYFRMFKVFKVLLNVLHVLASSAKL